MKLRMIITSQHTTDSIKALRSNGRYTFTEDDLSISDFNKPENSFSSLKKIEELDFLSVKDNNVFISRTSFGYIINALPQETKYNLVFSLLEYFKKDEPYGINFIEAIKFIKSYIDARIMKQGEFLIETDNIIDQEFSEFDLREKVGFIESTENPITDKIKVQSAYFRVLIDYEKEFNIWQNIFAGIKQNQQSEEKYNQAFTKSKKRWPINLNL